MLGEMKELTMSAPICRTRKLVALYGSPRRQGNTSRLLNQAATGARAAGAVVEDVFLGDLSLSPCLEDNGCRDTGRCVIADDFQRIYLLLDECDGLLLASPVFFGGVSAQAKILIDRCQCFWAGKYLLKRVRGGFSRKRPGLFLSAAARAPRPDLFEGAVRTVRYFFDALDVALWRTLLYPGLEEAHDVLAHEGYLREAFDAGLRLVAEVDPGRPEQG